MEWSRTFQDQQAPQRGGCTMAPPLFSTGLLRPVRKYHENMEYIHLNPVKRGLVKEAADWKRSSIHDYTGTVRQPAGYRRRVAARPDSIPADEPDLKVSGSRQRLTALPA